MSATRRRPRSIQQLDEATLHESEAFLADQLEREGDLAVVQVALTLWDASGSCDGDTFFTVALDAIDPSRFPRSLVAVERVRELLDGPVAARPEGFWPNFLLEQLASSTDYDPD